MRKLPLIFLTSVLSLSLAGCASLATENEPKDSEEPTVVSNDTKGEFSFSNINSCDEIAPFLAPWIEGLTPYDWNSVSNTEIHCGWDTSAGDVTPENARSIEVNLVKQPELPDYSLLQDMKGFESISNEWVTENGGEAFTLTVDIGLSASIGTTVWVPGVEATVSGASGANLPELDGPKGLEIAQQILTSQ